MPAKKSTLSIVEAQELVHIEGADVFATSRELAEHFKKRHKNILRKIENLSDETFSRLKIAPAEYLDKKGGCMGVCSWPLLSMHHDNQG